MGRHDRPQLGPSARGEPGGGTLAVGEGGCGVGRGDRLVHVVEERGRFHERPIDRDPAACAARREPARDLGDRSRMAEVPGRRLEREEEGGGAGETLQRGGAFHEHANLCPAADAGDDGSRRHVAAVHAVGLAVEGGDIAQGPLGQQQLAAPNCSADGCMHWDWVGGALRLGSQPGEGHCALDRRG